MRILTLNQLKNTKLFHKLTILPIIKVTIRQVLNKSSTIYSKDLAMSVSKILIFKQQILIILTLQGLSKRREIVGMELSKISFHRNLSMAKFNIIIYLILVRLGISLKAVLSMEVKRVQELSIWLMGISSQAFSSKIWQMEKDQSLLMVN